MPLAPPQGSLCFWEEEPGAPFFRGLVFSPSPRSPRLSDFLSCGLQEKRSCILLPPQMGPGVILIWGLVRLPTLDSAGLSSLHPPAHPTFSASWHHVIQDQCDSRSKWMNEYPYEEENNKGWLIKLYNCSGSPILNTILGQLSLLHFFV